jgi:hypothetical protein
MSDKITEIFNHFGLTSVNTSEKIASDEGLIKKAESVCLQLNQELTKVVANNKFASEVVLRDEELSILKLLK